MECGGNIMHTSEVSHVKSVEEFYKSIREQQEEAHGKEYCDQHDAIVKYMAECDSYKELGTHQGATAACAMLLKPKYVELVDINHYKYRWKLQELAEPFCQENNIELVVKEVDSSSLASLSRPVDMMLIDSLHRPDHMTKELNLHGVSVNKYIIAHDTYTIPSLQMALENWCNENRSWKVHERGMINAGYTVLKKNA